MGRIQKALEKKFNYYSNKLNPTPKAEYTGQKQTLTVEEVLKYWDYMAEMYEEHDIRPYYSRYYKNGGKIYDKAYNIKNSKLAKALK